MCKMNVVVNKLVLGNRVLGYECWSGKEIMEFTEKQIKDLINAGKQKVCGLKIGEDGELVLDKEGFFTTNMTIHSHIGSWKPMNEDSMANQLYVCVGSHEEAGKVVYDCISSRFEQAAITEADMRAYLKIGIVSGGAKLDGDKIVLADTEFPKEGEKKPDKPVEAPKVADKLTAAKKEETKPEVKPAAKEAGKK